jgi:hypothetical protein
MSQETNNNLGIGFTPIKKKKKSRRGSKRGLAKRG